MVFGSEKEEEEASSEFEQKVDFSGLFYIAYEHGEREGEEFGNFALNRAYLTAEADILPFLSGRITLDTNQDLEGDGRGDMEVRLKYAFAKFDFGDWRIFHKLNLEAGIVHMVWLDFEEHINLYRMRSPMFMERSGIFNSADFGLTLGGALGPELNEEYRERVNSKYSARHGSFAVGVYNGGGYHGVEVNSNKAVEGRLTYRPLPDNLPGLQVSGLAIVGEGNLAGESEETPDWNTYNLYVSYEHARGVATAQYVRGKGNQKGTWTEPDDPAEATSFSGWALFGELRFGPHWRTSGGYDRFIRRPGTDDRSFKRLYGALAYDLGRQNMLVFDVDHRDWDDPTLSNNIRYQGIIQLKF
jgi:hypothetical protein